IINRDDAFADDWLALNRDRRVLTFGASTEADVRIEGDEPLVLSVGGRRWEVPLALPGRHNAMNAAAATAACLALDLDMADIVAGLARVEPVSGRLQFLAGVNGSTLIDDTYNANPDSVAAAIALLASRSGKRYLALGDLAELGSDAEARHAALGELARNAGIEALLTVGELAGAASEAFGSGGEHFDSAEALAAALKSRLAPGQTVLVKGSRAARMERVVDALTQDREARHAV
ncbi:MAG TPA: UDP-N-acetylmuramoyl-tripeptide--D-alanyl-D-alanine ligase, partial [Gammaproteobacteria bacterium]|nr:UDP-N-acetylmuramoyl-tripeptide--D-alanyl-D-alanine ligase [Gammaproteobacteria bacterium]